MKPESALPTITIYIIVKLDSALAPTTAEIVWLRCWLEDMGVLFSSPTLLYCNSKTDCPLWCFHERTKHIEIYCHFVGDQFLKNTISLPHVTSQEKVADLFTKSQSRDFFSISRLQTSDCQDRPILCGSSLHSLCFEATNELYSLILRL